MKSGNRARSDRRSAWGSRPRGVTNAATERRPAESTRAMTAASRTVSSDSKMSLDRVEFDALAIQLYLPVDASDEFDCSVRPLAHAVASAIQTRANSLARMDPGQTSPL